MLFQMASFLGAFPFWELAPCILTASNLLKVVTLVTKRYKKILKEHEQDIYQLFFASIAVVDRRASEVFRPEDLDLGITDEEALEETLKGVSGFSITGDHVHEQEPQITADEGALGRSALRLLNVKNPGSFASLGERPELKLSIIPSDNLLHLIELILYATPMTSQQDLSSNSEHLTEEYLAALRASANTILAAFGVEQRHGVTYNAFRSVVPGSLPYLFDGLAPLFEHFLFDKGFDLSARKQSIPSDSDAPTSPTSPTSPGPPEDKFSKPANKGSAFVNPIPESGDILNLATLTQLSFFIPSATMFHRLHYLFAGSTHGFSLGSLETQVFTWRAPTILLVRGTLLPDTPSNSRERTFAESLPPKRFPSSTASSTNTQPSKSPRTVVYGAYISTPWKPTHKAHFGDIGTKLFQLSPVHDVFHASAVSKEYASYLTPSPQNPHAGINFGSPLPSTAGSKASGSHSSVGAHVALGPVSLYLDDSLEFGVFTHTAGGGGSFHPSNSPARTQQSPHSARPMSSTFDLSSASSATARRRSRGASITSPTSPTIPSSSGFHRRSASIIGTRGTTSGDWQDRFEIEALEVWGCGGDEEAEKQRRRIEGEEREARLRKEGVIGRTGDVDADREILRMAGLIGQYNEGGSV